MRDFGSFVNYKDRQNRRHLKTLAKIFSNAGFSVKNNLNDLDEPHLFIKKPTEFIPHLEQLSFGGVRIYNRGKHICYRCQMKKDTEPFGTSYIIDVEDMYKDLLENSQPKAIAKRIIFYIIKELRQFFAFSLEAERQDGANNGEMGSVIINGQDTAWDYANQVTDTRK